MKHLKYFTLFFAAFLSFKDITSQSSINTRIFNFGVHRNPTELFLPNACDLMTTDEIKTALNITDVQAKSTGNPGEVKVTNCFYKWNDPETPHAGMLLQVMTNPLYDDNPEYISYLVESKMTDGESVQGQRNKVLFKEIMIGKVKAVYTIENARIYWNIGDNYMFMLTFNINGLTSEKMIEMAQKLIPTINKNMIGILLE